MEWSVETLSEVLIEGSCLLSLEEAPQSAPEREEISSLYPVTKFPYGESLDGNFAL